MLMIVVHKFIIKKKNSLETNIIDKQTIVFCTLLISQYRLEMFEFCKDSINRTIIIRTAIYIEIP